MVIESCVARGFRAAEELAGRKGRVEVGEGEEFGKFGGRSDG